MRVGEARSLWLRDASRDAVLMLGPLYHPTERDDRRSVLENPNADPKGRHLVLRVSAKGVPGHACYLGRLLVACWEAYLEGLCIYAFNQNLANCKTPLDFPKAVTKIVRANLLKERDERKIWELAGDGWKKILTEHKNKIIKRFHHPKTARI